MHRSGHKAGILAAILAPTDAGLGEVIVTSPRVPRTIREALSVEAGLNDGLAVPFLLFFIALASNAGGSASLLGLVGEQLGLAVAIGGALGLGGGPLLGAAGRKGWMASAPRSLGVVAVPLLALLVSDAVGASMFIAAFVAGLAIQFGFPEAGDQSVEFTATGGQVLNLSVFFLFGLVAWNAWPTLTASHLLYAVLSLTVVRMLPVALALVGTHLGPATVWFMGWFGPRGLASIVLGLVYLEHGADLPGASDIRRAVVATVLLSIFAHGLSAQPGIRRYGAWVEALEPGRPERRDAGS